MKCDYFFIMGLPHSRTAWLANWFTHNNSFCTHEASRFCKRGIKSLRKVLHRPDIYRPISSWQEAVKSRRQYYGSSDSVNAWWYEEIYYKFPRAKFALIERNIDEVSASCERLYNAPCLKELKALHAVHQLIKDESNVKAVRYESLNHASVVQNLQQWLTPKIPFDYARYEMLNNLNVTINQQKYLNGYL